jgi:K319L-like, PKD domain
MRLRFMLSLVVMVAGMLVISGLASGASSSSSSPSAALGAAGTKSVSVTCPPTDQLGFALGEYDTSTDPIFCSYPAVAGEDPHDFYCTYSATTGALVEDHDAGLCQPNAVGGSGNSAPTASAGNDQTVASSATVNLDGTGSSDPDADTLTYAWSQTSGPSVTLSGANTSTPSFTAPTGPATLVFQLQVCDPANACDTDSVTITVSSVNEQLTALYNAVKNTPPGKALGDKVKKIQAYVAANNKAGACAGLNDFINLVKAQKGKKLTNAQVADFTAQANAIKTTLGC